MDSPYSNVSRPVLIRPCGDEKVLSDREGFLAECRMLATLDHDNVAALIGVVAAERPFCAVLEYSGQVRFCSRNLGLHCRF